MSVQQQRIDMLRAYRSREWTLVEEVLRPRLRIIDWLVDRGWLERHPEMFLSHVRITDTGFEILAQAGGDVTGWG